MWGAVAAVATGAVLGVLDCPTDTSDNACAPDCLKQRLLDEDPPYDDPQCPSYCSIFANVDETLGLRVELAVTGQAYAEPEALMDSTSTSTSTSNLEIGGVSLVYAYASTVTGRLTNWDGTPFTQLQLAPDAGNVAIDRGLISVKLQLQPTGNVVVDPKKLADLESLLACFPSTMPPNMRIVELLGSFENKYSVAFSFPGVIPAPREEAGEGEDPHAASDGLDNSMGDCPANLDGTVDETAGSNAVLHGCFPADATRTECVPLSTCGDDEYAANGDTRTKTEDTQCVATPPCGPAEIETAPATATSARTCVDRVDRCSVADGTVDSGTPGQCDQIEPCNHETTYMAAPATSVAGPTCRAISGSCDAETQYEAAAPTLETDRQCAAISADCDTLDGDFVDSLGTTRTGAGVTAEPEPTVSFYQSAAASEDADRQCSPTTLCTATEIEAAAPTATTDRRCADAPVPPPAPPECDPYGDGLCEPEDDDAIPGTVALVWNGVFFFGAMLWVTVVNLRETGTRLGTV